MASYFLLSFSTILFAGFVASWICKKLKVSSLIGYLVVGALIGPGGFDVLGYKDIHREIASAEKLIQWEKERQKTQAEGAKNEKQKVSYTDERDLISKLVAEVGIDEQAASELADKLLKRSIETVEEAVDEAVEEKELQLESVADETELRERVEELNGNLEQLSETEEFGVLLLLFAIGIEFTFDKLAATAKYMFVGGSLQMGLTILLTTLFCQLCGMGWVAGVALGSVIALSSTALVYRSMSDVGHADTKRAQATLGLLIFQDVALVPLLLILPRILGADSGDVGELWVSNPWVDMTIKSSIFCALVLGLKFVNMRLLVPALAKTQSNDLVILYAIIVLFGMCVAAGLLGLTPALGALAAGVALGENRLTHQIDALVLPFRETFSAIFFISLGMLTDFAYVVQHPFVCGVALVGVVAFKAACATLALKACGMDSRGALSFGTSISQVGELAFMLLAVANEARAINETTYNTMLFVAVASLVLTPNMVKTALTKFGMKPEETSVGSGGDFGIAAEIQRAIKTSQSHVVVVGAGHIGNSLANALIAKECSVCLIDFNPVNLQPYKQLGVPTVVGDGANQDVLRTAGIGRASIVFVTVPRDDLALNVVKSARNMNPSVIIAARARYRLSVAQLKRAGANSIVCEEERIADELVDMMNIRFGTAAGI